MIKIRSVCLVGVDVWQVKGAGITLAVTKVERQQDRTPNLANPSCIMTPTSKIEGEGWLVSQ